MPKERPQRRYVGTGKLMRTVPSAPFKTVEDVVDALKRSGGGSPAVSTAGGTAIITGLRRITLKDLRDIMMKWSGVILPCYLQGRLAFRVSQPGLRVEHDEALFMDQPDGEFVEKMGEEDDKRVSEIIRRMPLYSSVLPTITSDMITLKFTPKGDTDQYVPIHELANCLNVTRAHTTLFRLSRECIEVRIARFSKSVTSTYYRLEQQHKDKSTESLYGVDLGSI